MHRLICFKITEKSKIKLYFLCDIEFLSLKLKIKVDGKGYFWRLI